MQSRAQDAGKGGLVPPIIAGTGAKTTQLMTSDIYVLHWNRICNIRVSVFAIKAKILKTSVISKLGINVCIEVV